MGRIMLPQESKKEIVSRAYDRLIDKEYIIFAYLFGSFITQESFDDIDIAIFTNGLDKKDALDIELSLEIEIEEVLKIPVDVRVLNYILQIIS